MYGARGVVKTTLLLRCLKRHHAQDTGVLYVSLDDIGFSGHRLVGSVNLPVVSLHDILSKHGELSDLVLSKVKPLQFFNTYLKQGYYPFFAEGVDVYESRVEEVVNFILEVELSLLRGIETSHARKLKQLLPVISESTPFTPNVSELSERVGINRVTFLG